MLAIECKGGKGLRLSATPNSWCPCPEQDPLLSFSGHYSSSGGLGAVATEWPAVEITEGFQKSDASPPAWSAPSPQQQPGSTLSSESGPQPLRTALPPAPRCPKPQPLSFVTPARAQVASSHYYWFCSSRPSFLTFSILQCLLHQVLTGNSLPKWFVISLTLTGH